MFDQDDLLLVLKYLKGIKGIPPGESCNDRFKDLGGCEECPFTNSFYRFFEGKIKLAVDCEPETMRTGARTEEAKRMYDILLKLKDTQLEFSF